MHLGISGLCQTSQAKTYEFIMVTRALLQTKFGIGYLTRQIAAHACPVPT